MNKKKTSLITLIAIFIAISPLFGADKVGKLDLSKKEDANIFNQTLFRGVFQGRVDDRAQKMKELEKQIHKNVIDKKLKEAADQLVTYHTEFHPMVVGGAQLANIIASLANFKDENNKSVFDHMLEKIKNKSLKSDQHWAINHAMNSWNDLHQHYIGPNEEKKLFYPKHIENWNKLFEKFKEMAPKNEDDNWDYDDYGYDDYGSEEDESDEDDD